MPFPPRKILVVDENTDNGALLVQTLVRKFPSAAVSLCGESGITESILTNDIVDIAVVHRTVEEDAVSLIRTIRHIVPALPILVVSGVDRSEPVLTAGATGFMKYDEWLRVGNVVATILQTFPE